MENRVERTIEGIRDQVTRLSFSALKAIERAMRSLKEKDKELAKNVICDDADIDEAYAAIEAADIAEEVTYLPDGTPFDVPDLFVLSDCVIALLKEAVDAFLNSDVKKARGLAKKDDRIDELFLKVRGDVASDLENNSIVPEAGIVAALISKYLERIADHGVNLGEWVDYALTGEHGLS